MLSYRERHAQANREALATIGGLAVTIAVWAICGFGLSSLNITVFHTPLWIIGGTLGTWVCAIVVCVVLSRFVFADFDLETEGEGRDEKGVSQDGGAA